MDELYRRDKDANLKRRMNIFTISEIWERSLKTFSLVYVEREIREFAMEDDPDFEFVGDTQQGNVRITNKGKNNCEGL